MKNLILLFTILIPLSFLQLNAQAKKDVFEGENIRLKKKSLENDQTEFFYIKEANRQVKHGKYWLESKSTGKLIEGNYKNDRKSGDWSYYENGQLLQKYNWDSKTYSYIRPAGKNQTFEVFLTEASEKMNVDYEANVLGGKAVLQRVILEKLKMPNLVATKGMMVKLVYLIKITIDEEGKVDDLKLDEIIGHPDLTKALEAAIEPINMLNFYPGQKDGQDIKMVTIVPIDVDVATQKVNFQKPVYKAN